MGRTGRYLKRQEISALPVSIVRLHKKLRRKNSGSERFNGLFDGMLLEMRRCFAPPNLLIKGVSYDFPVDLKIPITTPSRHSSSNNTEHNHVINFCFFNITFDLFTQIRLQVVKVEALVEMF